MSPGCVTGSVQGCLCESLGVSPAVGHSDCSRLPVSFSNAVPRSLPFVAALSCVSKSRQTRCLPVLTQGQMHPLPAQGCQCPQAGSIPPPMSSTSYINPCLLSFLLSVKPLPSTLHHTHFSTVFPDLGLSPARAGLTRTPSASLPRLCCRETPVLLSPAPATQRV